MEDQNTQCSTSHIPTSEHFKPTTKWFETLGKDLNSEFVFLGPGWYFDADGGAMLIMPANRIIDDLWIHDGGAWDASEVFRVFYYDASPREMFYNLATAAPIRDDLRRESQL